MAIPRGGLIRFGRRPAGEAAGPAAADLVAALPTPLLVIDPAGVVGDANVASETLFNLSRAAIVGRHVEEMIGHPLTSVPTDAPFAAYDLEVVLPVDRHQRVDLAVAPLLDRPGWRVVTIHGRAPTLLAGRRNDRGTLTAIGAAAMLAHEIKNPLSGIRGAAQLLDAGGTQDGRAGGASELTRLIRDEVDRIAALIDRMEGFTDTRPLDLAPQNIHAILGHAREVALNGFARGLTIREVYDPSLPAVLGHRDALIQVLINLLKNAAEAMAGAGAGESGAGGTITLRTAYRHGVSMRAGRGAGRRPLPIEVCVIDDGPGAPEDLEEHLFDPFVTSKRGGAGGLGLALVDKLIADHHGIVEYAREGVPPRTVFRILLQRAPEDGA